MRLVNLWQLFTPWIPSCQRQALSLLIQDRILIDLVQIIYFINLQLDILWRRWWIEFRLFAASKITLRFYPLPFCVMQTDLPIISIQLLPEDVLVLKELLGISVGTNVCCIKSSIYVSKSLADLVMFTIHFRHVLQKLWSMHFWIPSEQSLNTMVRFKG